MSAKRFLAILWMLIIGSGPLLAQTTYSFNVTTDTAVEANANVIAGYVKADMAPMADDSVQISLAGPLPRASHVSTQSLYVLYFPAGTDSVPFRIQLYDDTFPEKPEHIHYQLNVYGGTDAVGTNRMLDFTLIDNDLPATITFVLDSGSAYIDDGTYPVCVSINNPNPFNVRFYTRTFDHAFTTPLGVFSAIGGWNYFYDWDTAWAPPGISTRCEDIRIVYDTAVLPDKTLMVVIQNLDDNILIDSTFNFTIKNDNGYYPPSVSFDLDSIIILKDTLVKVGIPVTTINPNHHAFPFIVDTIGFESVSSIDSFTQAHVYLNFNTYFSHPGGTWHDTVWVTVLDNHLIDDTSTVIFRIKGVRLNTSPDTFFYLTMIDTGAFVISFKGAAYAHLKLDSIGYVQVYTSGVVRYPLTANVTYLNGNAVMGTDFLWQDTQVTFPPNAYDTISLPVVMLRNGIHDGNKQINFLLSGVSPATPRYDIIQYTYTIIDNDSTAQWPSAVSDVEEDMVQVYPNPFVSAIHLHTTATDYIATITDMIGRGVKEVTGQSGDTSIALDDLPQGSYLLRLQSGGRSYTRHITKL